MRLAGYEGYTEDQIKFLKEQEDRLVGLGVDREKAIELACNGYGCLIQDAEQASWVK